MFNSKLFGTVQNYLDNKNSECNNDIDLLKSSLSLFKETIDEFGAISPEDAVNFWAKGVKTRNGALQYSVLNKSLKAKMEKSLKNTNWVTGASSPWVENYTITQYKKINKVMYKAVVCFHLIATKFDAGYVNAELLIQKSDKYWVISRIK